MASSEPSTTQYDAFATSYDLLWRVPAVRPLLPLLITKLSSIGPFTNASGLDLACGTGLGLRLLRAQGASELVGVDLSPQMLEVAKNTTQSAILHLADCTKPLDHLGLQPGSFDVVLGMWLLNYCPSSVELGGMWANIATYLKPGGKFVGIIENHDIVHPTSVRDFKYGAKESDVKELANGQGWSVHVAFQTKFPIEFDAFRLRKEILESEAAKVGMVDIEYSKPQWNEVKQVMSEGFGGEDGKAEAWWAELVDEAPNLVLTATKQL
ncbi:S-adenosyl-L-methionine-dependent methyltransferase [Xylariales sp. PMI_506]|nr:S-adenosyl-L-methionine-dependent methyltransferase [Xylariales sp. PMI_506]